VPAREGSRWDDAAFCIDADQFDGASDEAFLRSLNIPLIRRAGDLRTAAITNLRAPLWIHNAAGGFPPSGSNRSIARLEDPLPCASKHNVPRMVPCWNGSCVDSLAIIQ